jgi:hypothetical protein
MGYYFETLSTLLTKNVSPNDWKRLSPSRVTELTYFQVIPTEYYWKTQFYSEKEKLKRKYIGSLALSISSVLLGNSL